MSSRRGPNGITDQQRKFIREYLVDLNGTQAAIRAGYAPGSANVSASRLLARDNIKAAVQEELRAQGVTAERVTQFFLDMMDDQEAKHADRLRAGEALGRVLAMFTDKTEVSGDLDVAWREIADRLDEDEPDE